MLTDPMRSKMKPQIILAEALPTEKSMTANTA